MPFTGDDHNLPAGTIIPNGTASDAVTQHNAPFNDVSDALSALAVRITGKQAASANLDEYAAVNPTAAGLALLDDANADAQLTTLGGGASGISLFKSATPATARAVLDVPSYDELLYIDGMEKGLTGNAGDDQTTELQAIVNTHVPVEGGIVKYRGYVDFTTIDLYGRRNIVFQGEGGNGSGAAQRSILRCTAGAIGAGNPAIKLWKTFGIGFEKTMVLASDAAFNGVLIDFNATTPTPGDDSALMHIRDAYIGVTGASGVGLDIYGATQGVYENITFSGPGKLIALQDVAGVGFCNVHRFANVYIKPTGTAYPVVGSGEVITWEGCNTQASSSDGVTRWWQTSLNQPFKSVNIRGCSTYDTLTSGGIQCNFLQGSGLNLIGNQWSGTSTGVNYAVQIGGGTTSATPDGFGVSGIVVLGNTFEYFTAAIAFSGTVANNNEARSGVVGGNYARGTMSGGANTLIWSNISNAPKILFLPNQILNASPNSELLDGLYMYDWPNYANRAAAVSDGRTTGQVFKETTSGEGRLCVV